MTEFDVKKALSQRSGQVNKDSAAPDGVNGIPNSVLTDVFAGKRQATSEMMGHRADLAPSIAAKMSQAFGMDVSGVQVYRSDAMNGTGMRGMAQGNKVVLGSDVDLNSLEGQAVLGHELSHIRAQSMGVGSGRGLLSDASLEHQADTEGMLAARGMSISGESMGMSMGLGMAGVEGLSPIGGGLGASAGAPMQADKVGVERGGLVMSDPSDFSSASKVRKALIKQGTDPEKVNLGDYVKETGVSVEAQHDMLADKHKYPRLVRAFLGAKDFARKLNPFNRIQHGMFDDVDRVANYEMLHDGAADGKESVFPKGFRGRFMRNVLAIFFGIANGKRMTRLRADEDIEKLTSELDEGDEWDELSLSK